jgi:predicted nucleic acid-binding protein
VIVIADASPLQYLILIEHTHILQELFGQVFVPPAVITELTRERTPIVVQQWMADGPDWLHVQRPSRSPVSPRAGLGPGELEAIALAEELSADALLMDDRDGRREAERRGIAVLGTLRVLAAAAEHGLADLSVAFERLRGTNFRASEQLMRWLLDRETTRTRAR